MSSPRVDLLSGGSTRAGSTDGLTAERASERGGDRLILSGSGSRIRNVELQFFCVEQKGGGMGASGAINSCSSRQQKKGGFEEGTGMSSLYGNEFRFRRQAERAVLVTTPLPIVNRYIPTCIPINKHTPTPNSFTILLNGA